MKKFLLAFLLLGAFVAKAQEVKNDTINTISIDSLKETIAEHSMKFSALDERLATSDAILEKLAKIKISGYIQAQFEAFDYQDHIGPGTSTKVSPVTNTFSIRRARLKFTYEAVEGVKFVLQPEFAFDKVTLKDAFVRLNDRWMNTFALTVGQFDRPNYEVEYSSSSLESIERTRMSTILYPGERDLGAKIEADFDTQYKFPLKLQLAVLNGNFNLGTTTNQLKDVDSNKDVMARAVYSLKLPNKGLGIDFGAHGYFGTTQILAQTTSPTVFSDVNNNPFTPIVGDKLDKKWFGGEMQIYYDFLGGMALKGEYISGTISAATVNAAISNSTFAYNRVRDFKGFYTQLIKNVGTKNQLCVRYDAFDPNKHLSGNSVTTSGDLKYSTWVFSWHYYFDDNIKITAGYTLPINETSTIVGGDYLKDKTDNTFTLRFQAKF